MTDFAVRNQPREANLRARWPWRGLVLTPPRRRQQLAWVRSHIHWTLTHWRNVIFNDESHFQLHRADGWQRVWRRSGEPNADVSVVRRVLHDGGGVLVRVRISHGHRTQLHVIVGNLNAVRYRDEIPPIVLPSVRQDNTISSMTIPNLTSPACAENLWMTKRLCVWLASIFAGFDLNGTCLGRPWWDNLSPISTSREKWTTGYSPQGGVENITRVTINNLVMSDPWRLCGKDVPHYIRQIEDVLGTDYVTLTFRPPIASIRELNDLLDEYDPNLNFYNEIYKKKAMHKYYYLTESSFKDKLSLSKCIAVASFSLCHINIRSLYRNLDDFIFLTKSVGFEFSVLGFSETWLRDNNCDLYGIPGYSICEKHRHNAIGGDVAIYVMHDITYTERCDISYFDECMESVFIEIAVYFKRIKI